MGVAQEDPRPILQYCETGEDIPDGVLSSVVSAVVRCRIGNGAWYHQGVSPNARPLYDRFLGALDERGAATVIEALEDPTINVRLRSDTSRPHAVEVLKIVRRRVVSERLAEAYDLLLGDEDRIRTTLLTGDFKRLFSPFATRD